MFGKLKERFGGASGLAVAAPVSGSVVPLEQVPDPTFAQGILGKGVAIEPDEGCITAPADGTVEMMFDTGHAISMTTADGIELLIHVGIDTVALKGRHYKACCRSGDTVRKGDKLIEFDCEAIRAEGYQTVTPVIVCNADSYSAVRLVAAGTVAAGDNLLAISKK
nr:PTS glucose transporter subunit IIA [uncultured Agathobaculum sp.]